MNKATSSLRQQMTLIILLCWLLPMAIAATVVGWYLLSGAGRQKEQAMSQQLQLNLQLGADRVNSAVEASLLPSYDPELRDGWNQYRRDGNHAMLYRRYSALFGRLYQEELARRDAQIKALQAHINPHFPNNTLETINWQARMSGDVKASRMIEALSTVLDAALDRKSSPQVRLAEEMTYVNAYLYIVAQRFGKRLTVDVDLPEELMDCLVPRLILQPVIENAVEHGIGASGQGRVALRGSRRGDGVVLEIQNGGEAAVQGMRAAARRTPQELTTNHKIGYLHPTQKGV